MEIHTYRVETQYYKLVKAPRISRHISESLLPWNTESIRQDHGKTYLAGIPKFDGFTCISDHLNFKYSHYNFYNTYAPLSHKLKKVDCNVSLDFVKHIFGAHYELGLDYLKLLFVKPTQILPILCLVSRERSTGKSTFLKWLKLIFENNLTYLTKDSFTSQFNSDLANKLLFGLENNCGGWELRNKSCKILTTPKSFSLIKGGWSELFVLERMFDLLSLATISQEQAQTSDLVILNSLSYLPIVSTLFEEYKVITLYLDHDTSGREATEKLLTLYSNCRNGSDFYKGYKDLNKKLIQMEN